MKMREAARAARDKSAEFMDRMRSRGGHMLHEEKIYFETLDDPDTVKELLLHVVEGIDQGRVILANEDEEMVLYPGSLIKLAIKGKRSQNTSKIKMSVSWSRLDEDRVNLNDEPLFEAADEKAAESGIVDADPPGETAQEQHDRDDDGSAPEHEADKD